jgi:hypothetical protein
MKMAMILVPALITLAITILRVVGELQHWSKLFFNPAAGGGFGLVGISWLIPILGVYFAVKLKKEDSGPASAGKAVGFAVLAIAVFAALNIACFKLLPITTAFMLGFIWTAVAVAISLRGWPSLGKILLVYAFAARIPVAIVMFFAIQGNWGTHYDVVPPNNEVLLRLSPMARWFDIGFVPQMTIWIFLTVVGGMLFGAIAAAAVGGKRTAS